jgi:carboxylesterase
MRDLSFRLPGSGRKGIVLIHGLTGSPVEMKFLARQLYARGLTVHAPTLAGHGSTKQDLVASTYEDWVSTIRLAIREMALDVDEVYVAGVCVGGMVGLRAAILEGEAVRKVAIYSPAFHLDGWNVPRYQQFLMRVIAPAIRIPGVKNITVGEPPPYGVKWERLRQMLETSGGIEGTLPEFPVIALYQHHRLNQSLRKVLPNAKIPLLLVHSLEDDLAHIRNARKLRRLYGGEVRLEVLDDSYHMVHIDKQRNAVARWTAEMCSTP